jgi:hypothetical protein
MKCGTMNSKAIYSWIYWRINDVTEHNQSEQSGNSVELTESIVTSGFAARDD